MLITFIDKILHSKISLYKKIYKIPFGIKS